MMVENVTQSLLGSIQLDEFATARNADSAKRPEA